jgi:elongation factor Ts
MSKFLKHNTLLAQDFVKNQDKTIEELITEVSARTGEKIGVGQFFRIKVGEEPA